jgi:hypothetical protein
MLQEVSDELFRRFTEKARAELEQEAGAGGEASVAPGGTLPESEALDAVSLGGAVAGSVARRFMSQPLFWVAIAVAAVVVFLIVR